jgi:hypothetical protein
MAKPRARPEKLRGRRRLIKAEGARHLFCNKRNKEMGSQKKKTKKQGNGVCSVPFSPSNEEGSKKNKRGIKKQNQPITNLNNPVRCYGQNKFRLQASNITM